MVSICRLCASLKKTENLTFIRDSNHDLCQKLAKCCHLTIGLKDGLPKGVCAECVRSLNGSFEFYERVHESQQSLQKLYKVETSKKVTEMVVGNAPSEDQPTLDLMVPTAAVANDKDAEVRIKNEENKPPETDVSDDVARVIQEILGVKQEPTAYVVIDSETEDDVLKSEKSPDPEDPIDELNSDSVPQSGPDACIGIEIIEEDEEEDEIYFESDQYEIIEEVDEEETPVEDQTQYEPQDVEDNPLEHVEYAQPSTSVSVTDGAVETWLDYEWKCVRCLDPIKTAKQLTEHSEQRHLIRGSEIEWICADCQKTFTRYYSLINHIRQRHRPKLALLCDVCNESCGSFKDLEEHRQTMHKHEENLIMLLCVTCGKGFLTTNSLQIHSKCHLPDDVRLRYSCNLCDKKFRTTSNLKFHQKMHAGTRDFVCDQCGKKFLQRANLEEHLVTHLTFTPYECSICQKLFKTPERLTRHKQRHNDDKPFSCKECDKTFRTKDAMSTHMRIHTGEMPFACEFCQKPFRFRSTLMTHHNVHTGTRPYSCAECNHHFTNWPNYNKHMKRRHGIDVSSKNPRGKKPSKPAQPLKKIDNPPTVRRTPRIKLPTDLYIYIEQDEDTVGAE